MENTIRFTGITVTFNGEKHLEECLMSLGFCDELLVIDLGSSDRSIDIAVKCNAIVSKRERVQIVEEIREEAVSIAKHDWIVFIDPDEVLPNWTGEAVHEIVQETPNLAVIRIPWQFYFRGKRLNCTVWGEEKSKPVVFNRIRVKFELIVHEEIRILNGFEVSDLSSSKYGDLGIKHYWVDSYWEMFEKHIRYISKEGEARYNRGERFSWRNGFRQSWDLLRYNLIELKGLQGGVLGIGLSLFYSIYIGLSLLSLRSYSKRHLS